MRDQETITNFRKLTTPFYYYDLGLLRDTLSELVEHANAFGFKVHYALKANPDRKILATIREYGLGADCVSGNEVQWALDSGFASDEIVFAGVGKSDEEIRLALQQGIFCFNCESLQELEVIGEIAESEGVVAKIALRINPDIDPQTHRYITTGLEENKFGISPREFANALHQLKKCAFVELIGLHFHIGSQITSMDTYRQLCLRVNEINNWFTSHGCDISHLNLGGGLGIDYNDPDGQPIADFRTFFHTVNQYLEYGESQTVHFELGRAVVGQCGNLIAKVLYIKEGEQTSFAILDAGMTELIRPALYQASHKIENLTSTDGAEMYDVVGPICETSDCFGKKVPLPVTRRGDLIAIRSAGAYGQIMASAYNLRNKVQAYYSEN